MKNSLNTILKNNDFIVVYGNNYEDFINEFKNIIKKDNKSNEMDIVFTEIYYSDFSIEEFAQILLSNSMLLDKKTILLRDFSNIKDKEAKEISKLIENKPENNILIIDLTDNESIHKMQSKAEKLFPLAYKLKYVKPYVSNTAYIKNRIAQLNIVLSQNTIDTINSIAVGNITIVNNILGMAWMINDEECFRSILNKDLKEDNSPLLHFQFLDSFLLKQKNECFNLYRKLIRWQVLDEDELLTRLLSKLREFYMIKKKYEQIGEQALDKVISGKLPAFVRNNKKQQLKNMCDIWSYNEIINAFKVFYEIKRKMRTLKKTFAIMEFEQTLISQLRGQYGPKFFV